MDWGVQWMAGTGGATSGTLTHNQCRSDSGNSNQYRKRLHLVSTTPPFAECRDTARLEAAKRGGVQNNGAGVDKTCLLSLVCSSFSFLLRCVSGRAAAVLSAAPSWSYWLSPEVPPGCSQYGQFSN